ncbi:MULTISPECIES: maleylpyruvate isomerase N-terminal domain-containing protein [Catenuloplanes]|uniref:Uncharacterized protein (TIGR03083 family) n=1 Tax=Catenuloplanes niger TaxID=587534 RepID=A0AAE3ZX22_9ACTN|nr:maleylpyruvate isomerase N-terminal domain-containing protein [Catenuloplanes niger]MDR7326420.1 uncharacterized protein (TIGR03083 family) [Catenuloplanes niger]
MSTAADSVIAVLRAGHDRLTAFVGTLSPDDLTRRSAADEWTVAQVLSHLGSGAEIHLATVAAGRDGTPAPDSDFNKGVWARWDAMAPAEQAAGFVESNGRLIEMFEALDTTQRENVRVVFGWLPAPVDVATSARLRLSEFALHAWDVEAALDPRARVGADAVSILIGHVPNMFGFLSRTESLGGREYRLAVRLTDTDQEFGLHLGDSVARTETPAEPDGTLALPAEKLIRLVYGRLKEPYDTDGVSVTGPLSLDDLRRVFPGF